MLMPRNEAPDPSIATNQWNFSDYLENPTGGLSLHESTMRKTEKMLGATPGWQIELLYNGSTSDAIKIWDNKTKLHNIEQHVIYRGYATSRYEVITAGLRGKLNGVLPKRASELSILISEGKMFSGYLTVIRRHGKIPFMLDMPRQIEIYRQAGVPLPDAFLTRGGSITILKETKGIKIRRNEHF
jgi:hypothetical protein